MDEKWLEELSNIVRKAGDDLYANVDYLRDDYNAMLKEDEDWDGDYYYEDWLDTLTEIADNLIEYGRDLYGIGVREVQR